MIERWTTTGARNLARSIADTTPRDRLGQWHALPSWHARRPRRRWPLVVALLLLVALAVWA